MRNPVRWLLLSVALLIVTPFAVFPEIGGRRAAERAAVEEFVGSGTAGNGVSGSGGVTGQNGAGKVGGAASFRSDDGDRMKPADGTSSNGW